MSDCLFSLEFQLRGEEGKDSFASCVAMCVPRVGEKVSLYQKTHQGYHDYRVVDVEYSFDVRESTGRNPDHWGLQLVLLTVVPCTETEFSEHSSPNHSNVIM